MNQDKSFSLTSNWKRILTALSEFHFNEPDNHIKHTINVLSTPSADSELVGTGGGRYVYKLPPESHTSNNPYVVKFAVPTDGDRYLRGKAQNNVEAHLWEEHKNPTDQENVLVPVSANQTTVDGSWLIMPKGTPFIELNDEETPSKQKVNEILDKAHSQLNNRLDPTEFKEQNLVLINNTLCLCDYGYENPL
jgi:hypothetical protein